MYHINKEITRNGENLTLKNTAKHYYKKFDILGNSIQEGTPSINSEAPIESVGDNIQLFDKDNVNVINGFFHKDNTVIVAKNNRKTVYIECEQNTTYALSTVEDIVVNKMAFGYTTTIPAVGVQVYSINAIANKQLTITTGVDAKYLVAYIHSENYAMSLEEILNNLKISKGTSTGAYSPYRQGSIEIYNCNENLFDLKTYFDNCGVSRGTKTLLENGIKLEFEAGADCYTGAVVHDGVILPDTFKKATIKVKPNTKYTFQISSAPKCFISFLDKSYKGTQLYYEIPSSYEKTVYTFTTNENTEYIFLRFGIQNANYTSVTFANIQLEEGSTATDYVIYQSQTKALYTQQPFRAIGDVKDRFVKEDGVWYEEHNIVRKIFDGTEAINYISQEGNQYAFSTILPNKLLGSNDLCSNNFKVKSDHSWGEDGIVKINNTSEYIYVYISRSDFRNWLSELYNAGTPLYIDYVLAEPLLIPCTLEQVEQLEEIEKEMYSYDEVTNIYSTDTISPYFDVSAYQRISEEFKTRLKEGKITRGYLKVLATDTLPEIIIDENNYLKDLKIEELRYVPEEGFIGGAVAKRVSGNFNNVDNSFDIQDRKIEVYLGVELEDETTEYIKYGTYIIQRPEDDQVNDNTSFEALDYMVKFNQEYKDRITYPCTLKELLNDVLDQAGVNSKTNTFANSDFIVENNQFEQGTTLRDVIKAIAQVAFNWARIDEDDNFVMDFEMNENIDEELGTDDYFNFKKSDGYGPVNVIVLRNSQIEGENVTIKDENLINSPKGYNILNTSGFIKNNLLNVEVTRNEDGSFTINGTTDANSGDIRIIYEKPLIIPAGDCTFTYGINGLNMFNNEVNLSSLGKGTYMAIRRMSVSSSKTTLTFENDFEIYNYNIHLNPNTTFNNLTIKPMIYKGHNEKQFQPYIPIGEIEYVISDNPFAYTELKRKQLIEAGRRLFGLRYTPMAVDMLGLMYLNAKDRISVENLNGEKFNTYLLDHTIDYTGIVLDSMQSQAKTKTETKYQYISSLAQGLSHVEIKVDKANKKIESIVQTQEDVSEKVAKTVARIEVVYALSDSPTTEPTNGWSTTAPEWTAGKYMWQKTITTYANGTTAETAATNISGAKGAPGQNGVGIIQTNITYQKSTSGTTVPTGTWQTTIPEVNEDGYLWTRTEFIYSDGSKKYAYNVGKKGAAGIGVKSLVDQYYLSTSNTEQTGGEWTETQPEWQDKTYIWTRTKIVWTDNSITYTDPILANTLNNINSNIVVLQEFKSSQITTNTSITNSVSDVTRRLNNNYSTTEQVDSKINGLDDKYEILEGRVAKTELSSEDFKISIETIKNQGVDKITTSMGYTFNDNGLNINRDNADTGTIVDEAGIQVVDKTGAGDPTDILYAGYVKEDNTKYADYAGQTIVATSNLIVKNFLVIGSNSRFQDYTNPILGGQGTGVYDI